MRFHQLPSTADRAPASRAPVVVGVDGSPDGLTALTVAARDAALTASPLRVVIATRPRRPGASTDPGRLTCPTPAEGYDVLGRARRLVERVTPGERVSATLVDADPVRALLAAADGARLIVVGARGAGHEFCPRWGSVAVGIASVAPVPVLVQRSTGLSHGLGAEESPPAADWPDRVLVALAGDDLDQHVLVSAVDFSRRYASRVQVLTAHHADFSVDRLSEGFALATSSRLAPEDVNETVAACDVVVTRIDGPEALDGLVRGAEVQGAAARSAHAVLALPGRPLGRALPRPLVRADTRGGGRDEAPPACPAVLAGSTAP